MLKITIKVKENKEGLVGVAIKQISEREFEKATQNEKIIASNIKNAIEDGIKEVSMKYGKDLENEKES